MSLTAKIRKYSDYHIEYNQTKAVVKKNQSCFQRGILVISHAMHCTLQMQGRLSFVSSFKV